jgi:hypothetical protein
LRSSEKRPCLSARQFAALIDSATIFFASGDLCGSASAAPAPRAAKLNATAMKKAIKVFNVIKLLR